MTEKTSRIAIVTGASRGIGAAVAERLASDGLTVIVNYSGDVKSAEALTAKIERGGGRALPVKADVSNPKAVREMFDKAAATFGGIDVLINNAGIMKLATIVDSDDALFDQQIAINLKGSFNTRGSRTPAQRRPDRQFLDQRRRHEARDLRRLCRDKIGGRNHDGDPVEGVARP